MKIISAKGMSNNAVVGDILFAGRFRKSGSPAREKEPFFAFRSTHDPMQVSCIRHDDQLRIEAEPWPHYHGRTARIDTHAFDPRSARQLFEIELVFDDNGEVVPLSGLPGAFDFKFVLTEGSERVLRAT